MLISIFIITYFRLILKKHIFHVFLLGI